MNSTIKLFATLKEVDYSVKIANIDLPKYPLVNLKSDTALQAKANCLLKTNKNTYAFSQWVSPKRTRSFPYARVYDTLSIKNRITLIPFCKDEGLDGDRDFIQWDTVSLMSLLNVYVIVGYYIVAKKSDRPKQKHKHKITHQIFDYPYVVKQIEEIESYHSSPLHWNLSQMDNLHQIAQSTLNHYRKISQQTNVKLHKEEGINKRITVIKNSVNQFRDLSRDLAEKAQHRESKTVQPKERIAGNKVTITMKNLLGGYYYMTADEGVLLDDKCYLIEKKHSAKEILPSYNDIKDALIKMVLFTNIDTLTLDGKALLFQPVIGLTSAKIKGYVHSNMSDGDIDKFIVDNNFNSQEREKLQLVICEAQNNQFGLFVVNDNQIQKQQEIISKL